MPLEQLNINQIRERLKSQSEAGEIRRAVDHEARLRLHGTLTLNQAHGQSKTGLTRFLEWWQGVLNNDDKFGLFTSLLTFPLPTVAFTGQIFAALEKVFDGRNPVQQYDFTTPEIEADWQQYRDQKRLADFIRKNVWDTAKEGGINSLIVVDLPTEQTGTLPEPYAYLLDFDDVIDYEYEDGEFEFIAFETEIDDVDCIAWFDPFSYRIFSVKKGSREIVDTLIDVPHTLGRTPVQFMWDDAICIDEEEIKESPLSKWLGELDWLLGYKVSKRVNEMVAQYPIYWNYAINCDYELSTPENGVLEQCHGGFLRDGSGNYILEPMRNGRRGIAKCPRCAKARLIGPGSMVEKPFPDGQDTPDVGAPVGVVPAESVSLEYNSAEVARIERAIFVGVTGSENEAINNKAVNEKQVGAIVESKTQALKNLKRNLEKAQTWVESTICQLRYGEQFQGVTVNFGTEFHLLTADEVRQQYELARKNGESMSALDRLWEDYLAARYRFDPAMRRRELILMHLDPFRHRTAQEVAMLPGIKPELVYLKFNFSSLLMRFEREQTNVMFFGSAVSFDAKIKAIQQTLIEYAKEFIGASGTEPASRNGAPN